MFNFEDGFEVPQNTAARGIICAKGFKRVQQAERKHLISRKLFNAKLTPDFWTFINSADMFIESWIGWSSLLVLLFFLSFPHALLTLGGVYAPGINCMSCGVIVGDSGLCCCVPVQCMNGQLFELNCFPLIVFVDFTLVIPCRKFGQPYLGKATATARTTLPSPTSVCWVPPPPVFPKSTELWHVQDL